MITYDFFCFPFQRLQASTEPYLSMAVLRFNQVLLVTRLPRFVLISKSDKTCQSSPKRQKSDLCCHAYTCSTGILTCFPLPLLQLGAWLGSTYPWLNCVAKEPLPFRWYRFSRYSVPTITRIFISIRSIHPFRNTSALTERLPTTILADVCSIGK